MQGVGFLLLVLFLSPAFANTKTANLPLLNEDVETLNQDLKLISAKANLPLTTLKVVAIKEAKIARVSIRCEKNEFLLSAEAPQGEHTATVYKGIRELGFLFPHPMTQISPTMAQMKRSCGKSYLWRPALKHRGFHLHNLHPNEWVHGFYMNRPEVAEAFVRWSARSGQNLLEMSILRTSPYQDLVSQLTKQFTLARKFQIHTGITIGLAFTQQKSYKLLSIFQSIFGWGADESIREGLAKLFNDLPLSFIFLEAGTSEFTPTNYAKTLDWLNLAGSEAKKHGGQIFTRAHISSNQHHEKFGNYNFLSQYAGADVGVLPHTVMFYGLLDERAPMYGNQNFFGMREFMLQERTKRPTWFYPETSWWLGMDIDMPLLLTDYLLSRAQDLKLCHERRIDGHINFTTGHALGYWLFDWNLALLTDLDYDFDPLAGLKLLGEPSDVWDRMVDFQHEWIKKRGLIALLSSANLQDELSETERIHLRFTMKELWNNKPQAEKEVALLEEGLKHWPDFSSVKHPELKTLLEITKLRHLHALELRHSFVHRARRKTFVGKARDHRREAARLVGGMRSLVTNYPELPLFDRHENPTSYQFGYAYPAASMYFWKREERQASSGSFAPWNGNMYDVFNILF